ncbi:hypothetical protein MK525_09145 [Streptococcus gallolyticus subsp. gallolyticus]|uniref:hypothetical protein n=1 Tax=Streptococcus gallolyticus TaxID=315405 RepID=UPI000201B80B|nr:hypothetical protein [Streptococcus gallolyticus]MCY7158639.1 hypothetical protein [Streptococcus gallolyticus subsp. gallolyticus]BAK27426.1 predicted membrane protein [Streptococcus gallolyticus subsp. gallolyticus ATCC 43143]CBZ47673.1 hypothetical protein SGGBAA2069_c05010 [Streptococcus gallolyticus subsp. gallolyticus ATCC BAA-2069]
MGLIERLKLQQKRKKATVKKGMSRLGNLSGLFIFYPLILLVFYGTMNNSELPMVLNRIIFYSGIVIWVTSLLLTVWDFLRNNRLFVGLSTYLMFIYGLFLTPIMSTTAWGNGSLQFIILQEVSIILYPIIFSLIMAMAFTGRDGNFRFAKLRNIVGNIYIYIPALMTVFGLLMSYFVSEYYVVYLFWGLAIFCSVMIDLAWYIAFYPLHHKGTSAVASKAQSQAVDTMGDTLQEKQFDKDEFTEE